MNYEFITGKGINRKTSVLLSFVFIFCCLLAFTCSPVVSVAAQNGPLMDQLRQAASKDLRGSISEDIEIKGLRIVKGAESISNSSEYKINSMVMDGYSGRNKVNYIVKLSDKKPADNKPDMKSLVIEASFDMLTEVFITTRAMNKGTVLTTEDFFTAKHKGSKLSAGTIMKKKDFEGKMLKGGIGQGVVLRADHLTSDLTVKRGQKVEVKIEGGNLVIATKGVLKSDTVIGGVARVMCDVSRKEVNGILVNTNTVKVKI